MVAQATSALMLALAIIVIGSRIDSLSLSAAQYALVLAFSLLGIVVFLSIGQALVGLIRSAAAVNAAGRAVFVVLAVLGLLGEAGALGGTWAAIAPWTPLGAVMTLYARVLDLTAWSSRDTDTSENGPLAAETRPGGPLSSCHGIYQGVSLRVDA